jgi:predicted ATPase/DNA-binding NarL/FixJ family response regulator
MERVEQKLGNYRKTRLIGTGAFADTYLGTHIYLNTHVAIKVPRGHFDTSSLDSFLAEARLLANLVHPHIVRLIDFGVEGETPYLVMDYASGGNLGELHPAGSIVPLSRVVTYVSASASALQYAHRERVIHRDLKPENLLLGSADELLLSDFGLALFFPDDDPVEVQERFGTLEYMAPEQIRGQVLPASDQYALAVMAFEWLSGQLPFEGTATELIHQHLYTPPASFNERHPELSPAIEEVLFKALSKDPAQRFVDVLEFADAFVEASRSSMHLSSAPEVEPDHFKGEQVRYNNLPRLLTPLIGREQEKASARNLLLRPEIGLLTLTGTPGVGKTRLAMAIGADLVEAHTHGVCYVPLAQVSDPEQVGPTIVHTLALSGSAHSSSPYDQLTAFLRDKQLLLVLDNFEQILGASSLVAELLSMCPRLKILVTSRVPLHLEGEQEFPVAPLPVPDVGSLPPQEVLAQVPAVALFIQRAQAVQPWFTLTEENAAIIANLCNLLDGLPLAIVLAAARIKLFSPQELLDGLQQRRFELLTGHDLNVLPHQRTLRDTITWSYNLLSFEEQKIFRWLSVFVGEFTLEAAEAVSTHAVDSAIPVLEVISLLVDHSLLLVREYQGGKRYLRLLEMIREYGMERLRKASELERARYAHAAYYLELGERVAPVLNSREQVQWAEQLKLDYVNIRAAIQWLLEGGESDKALRLVAALQMFWTLQNYTYEGRYFLAQALEATAGASSEQDSSLAAVRARALYAAGDLAFFDNDPGQATLLLEESERLSRKLQEKQCLARALSLLGLIWHNSGEAEKARVTHEEALKISREAGVKEILADILTTVGVTIFVDGAFAQAREIFEECLVLLKELGDAWNTALVLHYLGWAMYEQREYAQAQVLTGESLTQFRAIGTPEHYADALITYAYASLALGDEITPRSTLEEVLSLGRELGNQDYCARALCGLGHLALRQGDQAQARINYEESIALVQGRYLISRLKWVLASSLEGLGEIALAEGQAASTVRLYACAEAVRAAHGYYCPLFLDQPYYDRTLATARAQLGEKAFAASWAEGLVMTPQEVIAAGPDTQPIEVVDLGSPARHLPQGASVPTNELTAREIEVLRLLARGLSNNQIAEELVLSPFTVNKHTQHIYDKLSINTRSAATRYAIEHDLV